MEIFLDCLPCALKQILVTARMTTDRIELHEMIMKDAMDVISDYKSLRCSPEISRELHQIVKKHTGVFDPYKEIKRKNIEAALKVYPSLKQFLFAKKERLYWVLKIAATGNVIDSAIYNDVDVESCVEKELDKEFSICDINEFEKQLKKAKSLLIIGDNAGETVFDRVLVEELLHINVIYAVRNEPIINDATIEDAVASGLDCCTRIVSTGCNAPGLILDECSDEFLNIFNNTDIVISKGLGNYEALSDQKRGIFFLLKAKCPIISGVLGIDVNDFIFKWNGFKSCS